MNLRLSILDFCTIHEGHTAGESMAQSVKLAQLAEELGFFRMWYTEHHNMPVITSSAPAVLISHIGAKTSTIRLGSGGVMLPNHAPYVVAEQFGTLAELYPGRIDLGVGRSPGTDRHTLGRALRRDSHAAERFPEDVRELIAYLDGKSLIPGVSAIPGSGTRVPVYILGSSMFGASLAAKFGLPYAFASHFAPTQMEAAVSYYQDNFQPSERLEKPYTIVGVNVANPEEWEAARFRRVKNMAGRGKFLTDEQVTQIMESFQGKQILDMLTYTAVGDAAEIRAYLTDFAERTGADELMISPQAITHEGVMETIRLAAHALSI